MNEASTYAFKAFEALEKRLDRIESLVGQLVDQKNDREAAAELTVTLNAASAELNAASR